MITFERLLVTMEKRGISTYQLRERCGIDSKTIRRLRANENISTEGLGLSKDIAEYKSDL